MFASALPAAALELRVGPQPLERALVKQLFSAPDGRYYLRGSRTSGCFLYAQHPQLSFAGNRIVLALQLEGKLGREFAGQCFGVHWGGNGRLSMLPQSQGANIGFTDVRVERLTGDGSIDQLLGGMIARLAPRSFHVDAGALVNNMLRHASARSGATITLGQLTIQSLQVKNNVLDATLDGTVDVQ